MATRSTISIKEGNEFKTIYCHWDGYPQNNGKILLEHFQDEEKVKKLIELGDISRLSPNLEPTETSVHIKTVFSKGKIVRKEFPDAEHSFETPHEGVVIAYGRDRGEKKIEARTYKVSIEESEEYNYLFSNGKWKIKKLTKWVPLTKTMCE